jgi:hypothetical protein
MASIKYSCVMDKAPKFHKQTLIWAQTLIGLANQKPEFIIVHAIKGCNPETLDKLNRLGVNLKMVDPFDPRSPYCNKLVQLETRELQEADYAVLCDCDLAFCEDIAPWVVGDSVKAKVVGENNPSFKIWENILKAAGIPGPYPKIKPTYSRKKTYANNCNGGLYFIPKTIFGQLRESWPRWCYWMLDNVHLLEKYNIHSDQVSFGLAMAELGMLVEQLSQEFNFATQRKYKPAIFNRRFNVTPKVIHFHNAVDDAGYLLKVGLENVDKEIERTNSFLKERQAGREG